MMKRAFFPAALQGTSRSFVLGFFSAAMVFGLTSLPARANQQITWRDLINASACEVNPYACDSLFRPADEKPKLKDYDEIRYQITTQPALAPEQVELGFRSMVEWWKEVKVVNAQGQTIVALESSDQDTRTRRTTLNLEWLKGGKILFTKQSAFGVRRSLYEMPLTDEVLQKIAGQEVIFTWMKD